MGKDRDRPTARRQIRKTERTTQVPDLAVKGHQTLAIAEKLGISERTVQRHLGHALNRLAEQSQDDAEALRGMRDL